MQFLSQLSLTSAPEAEDHRDQTLLLFQCQNHPGLCDEWDPNSGGNAAFLVTTEDRIPMPVPEGNTLLPEDTPIQLVAYPADSGGTPDDSYCEAFDAPGSEVLGKVGGTPLWIQNDETPASARGTRMSFIVQLEERGGGGINFGGGGAGYAFICGVCRDRAKFLWQCA